MGIIDEIKAGQFTIYAQWTGLITVWFLVGYGLASFGAIPLGWIWAIISLVLAAIVLLVELPIITRCCPTRGPVASLSSFFESVMTRSIGYLIFAIVEFCGVGLTYGFTVAPGILLLMVSVLYGIALVKGQELKRSVITGGSGL